MSQDLLNVTDLVTEFEAKRGLWGFLRGRRSSPVRAVDGVNLHVEAGEFLALVGESGSGKTTLVKTFAQQVEATSGTVAYRGRLVEQMTKGERQDLRRQVQVVDQDPFGSLDPRFRVRQTVEEPLLIHGSGSTTPADRRQQVEQALVRVGLAPDLYLERYPHELSGGQRQRVAIATALVLQPSLLIADEPVSMLDVSVRAEILALLDDLRRDGLGIVMVTHDLSTAASYSDRVAVMYLGRIVEIGPTRRVIDDPQHPYTQALLSVVPSIDPCERRPLAALPGEAPDAANAPSGCHFHPRCAQAVDRCRTEDPLTAADVGTSAEPHLAFCHLVSTPKQTADSP